MQINQKNIPLKLKSMSNWVLWKAMVRNGKTTKIPFMPNNNPAKSNDPTTWNDFKTIISSHESNQHFTGIGFCLSDNLVGIDLDHIIDRATGEFKQQAQEIIDKFSSTYIEFSPSGDGLHIFCLGHVVRTGKGTKNKWVELYNKESPRYLTVTGDLLLGSGSDVVECQSGLDWLYENFFKKEQPPTDCLPVTDRQTIEYAGFSDYELLAKAAKSKNGAKIDALMRGDWQGRYDTQSDADAALCCYISFYSNDDQQIDRIFRMSGLFRPKWDRKATAAGETYGQLTIRKNRSSNTYDFEYYRKKQNIPSQLPAPNLTEKPVTVPILPLTVPILPPDLSTNVLQATTGVPPFEHFSQLVQLITDTARIKQPNLAVANLLAAIGVLLGGKVATEDDLRTNLYFCAVLGSGRGKDHSRFFIEKLFELIGCGELCSFSAGTGPAIVDLMTQSPPKKLLLPDEFGLFLEKVGDEKTGSSAFRDAVSVFNELFTRAKDIYHPTLTRSRGKIIIREGCLGVYATSTPDEFYKSLTRKMLSSGLLSRFIFVKGDENADLEHSRKKIHFPDWVLTHFEKVVNLPTDFKQDPASKIKIPCVREIPFAKNAKDLWETFSDKMHNFVRKGDNKYSSVYARAGEHVAKISLLLASFELEEEISAEAMQWSIQYVENAVNELIEALKGNMAENVVEDNLNRVLAIIKNKGGNVTKSQLYKKTRWLDKRTRDDLLNSLVESGELEVNEVDSVDCFKKTTFYKLKIS